MPPKPSLSPRKPPVQRRSQETLKVIHEASIQVLLSHGIHGLTTTRVAERAGVSVGSVYQYYPNKQALLAAVLQQHLDDVIGQIEAVCHSHRARTAADMAHALVNTFIDAKLARPDVSQALYAIPADQGRDAVTATMTQRAQLGICDLLASCTDRRFQDPSLVSFVLTTSLVGPAQVLMATLPPVAQREAIRKQLGLMAQSYLERAGDPL